MNCMRNLQIWQKSCDSCWCFSCFQFMLHEWAPFKNVECWGSQWMAFKGCSIKSHLYPQWFDSGTSSWHKGGSRMWKQDLGPTLRKQCHVSCLQSAPKAAALHLESEPQSTSEVVLVGESQFCSLGCTCGKNVIYQSKRTSKEAAGQHPAARAVSDQAVCVGLSWHCWSKSEGERMALRSVSVLCNKWGEMPAVYQQLGGCEADTWSMAWEHCMGCPCSSEMLCGVCLNQSKRSELQAGCLHAK